jgi:type I restriction enzyme R subunit
MKEKLNESQIENLAIKLLQNQGYQYFYGPEIAPDAENSENLNSCGKNSAGFSRKNFEEIVLVSVLKKAIEPFKSINKAVY